MKIVMKGTFVLNAGKELNEVNQKKLRIKLILYKLGNAKIIMQPF